jgi:hypothetical protein
VSTLVDLLQESTDTLLLSVYVHILLNYGNIDLTSDEESIRLFGTFPFTSTRMSRMMLIHEEN